MQDKIFLYNEQPMQYFIFGNGPAVVLLHGFGEDSSTWFGTASALAPHYCVLVPSLPGTGKSALLSGNNIGMEDYADGIKAILMHEQITRVVLIGHSMGGYITLAFAEKYPDMLRAFGLCHSTAYADDDQKKSNRKKGIALMKQEGGFAFLKRSTPGLFADAEKSRKDINDLLQKSEHFQTESLIQYYDAMITRPDRTDVLRHFPRPVLFIFGRHDNAVPLEQGLKQSFLPAVSHLHILENSAHMGMLEEPEKSLLKLKDFLNVIYV